MSYQCNDCSFSRKGAFPQGKCPACGSFNISGGSLKKKEEESSATKKWRMAILVASWSFLAILIINKVLFS